MFWLIWFQKGWTQWLLGDRRRIWRTFLLIRSRVGTLLPRGDSTQPEGSCKETWESRSRDLSDLTVFGDVLEPPRHGVLGVTVEFTFFDPFGHGFLFASNSGGGGENQGTDLMMQTRPCSTAVIRRSESLAGMLLLTCLWVPVVAISIGKMEQMGLGKLREQMDSPVAERRWDVENGGEQSRFRNIHRVCAKTI